MDEAKMLIRAIIDLALRNRAVVLLLTVLTAMVGAIVYQRMPKDIYPDLNAPLVNIITTCPGMASEDVERMITRPLENLMNGSPHVIRVRSESTTGESVVTVEFDWGLDIYTARNIVSGKLDIVAESLPAEASEPVMGPVSSRMGEIFEFAVVGDGVDPMELRGVADWTIGYRLLGVDGVSFSLNLGGFVRQYQVFLKPEMLHKYGITIAEVKQAIEDSNRNFSGGIIVKPYQEFLIKGLGRIESLEHIENTVVTSRDNVPVYVKHVADVKVGATFPRGNAGFNGKEAVSVVVQKQYGGDTVSTIDNVKEFLEQVDKDLPPGISTVTYYDQSELILSALEHVEISMLEGGLLVFLVILFFLGSLRALLITLLTMGASILLSLMLMHFFHVSSPTAIVLIVLGNLLVLLVILLFVRDLWAPLIASLTIPFSILFALILMHLGGVSLTVMALGGLAIGIGKMAGGSVIMVENIYKFYQTDETGASPVQLAGEGAKEIGPYLFSANLIIVLVFLPLLALEGIAGRMFRPTVYALVAALLGSLIMNITLKPVLMSYCLRKTDRRPKENFVVAFSTSVYAAVLRLCFRLKWIVLLGALAVLGVAGHCYRQLGSEFVPFLDEGSVIASTVMLPETSLEESVRIGKTVEEIFLSFPDVVSVCRTTGSAEGSEHVHPVNHSHYIMQLKSLEERELGYAELTAQMRQRLERHKPPLGIHYIFEQPIANKMAEMLTGAEGEISLKVFGTELDVLDRKAEEIGHVMEGIRGIADLQVEQTTGIPLVVVELRRDRLARHGLSVADVADLVETALNGVEVTDVIEPDRMTSVLLRLPEKYRSDDEEIKDLRIDTPSGQVVTLSDVAFIRREDGPQTIFRENLLRRKIILCNVVGTDIGRFVEEATAEINRQVKFDPGYFFEFGGQFEAQQRTQKQLMWMMLVVGLSVLVVLFASLGSFRQSVLLLLNIPMTLSGGILALYLTGQTLNVSSLIGFIALFGIALQNGVILVGKINDLRKQGVELHEAVIQGSVRRFRPILMTELILILGVLPLALGTTSGSEMHRPLAVVYIGGFVVAIFFEQIVLPILYEMFSRLKTEQLAGKATPASPIHR